MRRLAAQLGVPWHAIFVEVPSESSDDSTLYDRAARVLKLAANLGATIATQSATDVASALIRYARDHNLSRLVLGRSKKRWFFPWKKTIAQKIGQTADDLDILQVSVSESSLFTIPKPHFSFEPDKIEWKNYLATFLICSLTTLCAVPLIGLLDLINIVMLFLLAVAGIALRYGRGPAILAAFINVLFFDFFFVPPRISIAVSDAQFIITFIVMLFVALVIGQLTANLKMQGNAATERERRVRSLYEMSRDLSGVLMIEQIAEIAARFLHTEFGAKSALFIVDEKDHLKKMDKATAKPEYGTCAMGIRAWYDGRSRHRHFAGQSLSGNSPESDPSDCEAFWPSNRMKALFWDRNREDCLIFAHHCSPSPSNAFTIWTLHRKPSSRWNRKNCAIPCFQPSPMTSARLWPLLWVWLTR